MQFGMFLATQSVRSAFDEVRPDAPVIAEVVRTPRTAALDPARKALAGMLLRASRAVAPPGRARSECVPAR
ncbi:hypothetical protein WEH80_25855 [Actinomycetes bacterium KLBMP 9759]